MADPCVAEIEVAEAAGQHREVVRLAREASQRPLDPDARIRVRLALEHARMRTGDVDPAAALDALEAAAAGRWRGLGLYIAGSVLLQARRIDEAERCFSEAAAWARTRDEQGLGSLACGGLGLVRRQRRDLEAAARLLCQASGELAAAGDAFHHGFFSGIWADLLRWQGRYEEALDIVQRVLPQVRGVSSVEASLLRTEATIHVQRGDLAKAEAALLEALTHLDFGVTRGRVQLDLADLARAGGRLDEARAYLERALEGQPPSYGPIARLNLGMVELMDGERARAREAVEPVLSCSYSWYRLYAHAVLVAAEDAPEAVDLHLQALEMATVAGTLIERDLHLLYKMASEAWARRAPDRAARLRVLQYAQARGLREDVQAVEQALVALRREGAAVPLGPLDLTRKVACGGMGQVWRGTVRGTGLEVAVKVLAAERAHDAVVAEALRRELRAVARLDHARVVPLVDHGQVYRAVSVMTEGELPEGTPWLATRWAGGGTLDDWCGRRPFEEVREALLQVLDALAAAHAEGLLHLDVKPANVLVASGGGGPGVADGPEGEALRLWLADFGVARALGAAGDGTVAGTPAFMAPEQCRGAVAQYGAWTDLYAVGAMAVTLVQGRPPFDGTSVEQMRQQIGRPLPPLAAKVPVPEGFEGWCRLLMAKDPRTRYRCAADAAAALRALGDTPQGPVPGPAAVEAYDSSDTFLLDAQGWPEAEDGGAGLEVPEVAEMAERYPSERTGPTLPELAWAARRLLTLRPMPLVGRHRERQALWTALREASGGVRVVRLEAEPGAGRTHLMRWLARAAKRSGAARVVWVGPGARPGVADGVDAAALRQLLAQGEADRERAVARVSRAVQALAGERRVLVCLAAGEGERLVGHLRAEAPTLPILVVGLAEALAPAADREVLALGSLANAEIGALLDALVPLTPSLRARLVEAAAGEPATAVWTVRSWLVGQALVATPEGLALEDGEALPRTPVEAVQRMLGPLLAERPAYRAQAAILAKLGDEVEGEAWRRACAAGGVPFDGELVERMASSGLLVERGSRCAFTDRWVRRALLEPDPTTR